ncbi:putative DNA binding domain-containing protein [Candidatus Woesebacteria bacterium]|nr:putative DNA binding domain-containing protein [Candidatus Woesebacteria bacterium]
MTDQEILQLFLDTKEWQTFECKRAAVQPIRLLETVVALANTAGGFIVIGLEDPTKAKGTHRLIGLSENPDNVSEFLKLIDKEIDPTLKLWSKFELPIVNSRKNNDALLVVNVKKSDDVHSLKKGDTLVRKGKQNVKIGSTEIVRLKYEKGAIRFEDERTQLNTLDELNLDLLNEYKRDTHSENQDNWQFLKDNGLAIKEGKSFFMTKAGILLFGKNPSVTLKSKCGIKISHYYGTKPSYSATPNFVSRPLTVEGHLLVQIEQTLQYFRNIVRNSPPKLRGSAFRSSLIIPEWIFQEAVTNAVIHRNYSIQNDTQIRFFDDRIEVESPGSYPGHITVSNIRLERFARNPLILRTLNRFQEAPNLDIGEGVDRMFKLMKEHNLYEPLYLPPSLRPNSVLLVLFNLQRVEYWDTVSRYLDAHYRITNNEARNITGIHDTLKMSRLLKSWVDKGLLGKVGTRAKKIVFYTKFGQEVPPTLFSKGIENKSR